MARDNMKEFHETMKKNGVGGPGRIFKYRPGEFVGTYAILATTEKGYYRVRCRRCGAESQKRSNALNTKSRACAKCRNKHNVHGQLMTYAEIEQVFGIKRSLVLQRQGQRSMSLEEAIFTPVQQQPSPLQGKKLCTDCEKFLSTTLFSKGQGVCNKCRAERRRKKRSLRRNAIQLERRRTALVDCRVRIEMTSTALAWHDDQSYHDEYLCIPAFTARFWSLDDESEEKTLLAEAHGYLINEGEAYNNGSNILDICDAESQELYDVGRLIFSEELREKEDFISDASILYVSDYTHQDTQDEFLSTAQALYILNTMFAQSDMLVYGGTFVDLGVYGFKRLPTPRWREGYALWFLHNEWCTPHFPFPSEERWEEAATKLN